MKFILLIEDDPFLIDIYTRKFKKSGFEIKVAENSQKAFRIMEEKCPDLILLDIVLPQVDGWSILKKIKSNEAFAETKVVVFSNLSQKEEVEKGLGLGAVRYLIKSQHTPSEVVGEVKKMLLDNCKAQE